MQSNKSSKRTIKSVKEATAAPQVVAAEIKPKTRSPKTSKPKTSEAVLEKPSLTHHRKTVPPSLPEPPKASEKREMIREQVAELAYYRWQSRNGAPGNPEEDWFHAERQLAANA
jgi:hypothetical protein